MPSLFGGLARQAAALPPITPAAPTRGRGLIGGGQRPDMNSILTFLSQGTNGLDRNRANASAQQAAQIAEQQRAQREQYAATIQDPIERQVFMTAPNEWASNAAKRFAPETLAQGSVQVLNGRPVAAAPRIERFDDRFGSMDPLTGQTAFSAPREATYAEETGRINATNPVAVAQNSILADPRSGRTIATGMTRPDIANVAPGGTALAFGPDGQVINSVQSTAQRPLSDADQKAIAEAEASLARVDTATRRAESILGQIQSGDLNLGPMTNLASGARNMAGRSNPNSLNYDALRNWALEARNEILQDAAGVATDGDAVRALDQIISGMNDEGVVTQALNRFVESRAPAREVFQRDIARRQGQPQQQSAPQPQGGAPSRAALEAEARRRGLI